MTRLAKYLKPFAFVLVVVVALLFGQAMCDLNLPNLMSDIVNVGIQQGGIEDAAPDAITENGYKFATTFMTAEDKAAVDSHYRKVETGGSDADYDSLVKKYPKLAEENIYVRDSGDKDVLEALNPIFGRTTWTFINYMKEMAAKNPEMAAGGTDMENMSDLDITQIYAMLPMLEQMPANAFDAARETAAQTPESMQVQTGAAIAKAFYHDLGMDVGMIQMGYIARTGLYMLLIALLGVLATILVGFLASRIAAGVSRALRKDVFNKVESFSNSEFDKYSTASLITRTTNDITQIQTLLIMGVRMVCYAPIMGIGGVFMALNKSVSMGWIIAVACVVLIGLILVIFSFAMPKFKLVQKLVDKLNLVSRENLSGLMVIRAFGTRKFEEERFDKANQDLTQTNLFVNRLIVVMMPAMMLIMNGISLLIVWVGAHHVADSTMQVGDMMAFMQYAMQIIMSFLMIAMMFIMIPRAAVSANRIAEVLETEPTILDPKRKKEFDPKQRGVVEFKNVSFRYEEAEEDVLQNISFVATPGKTTAFIGSTGSGKTTLINLIPRFYDVTEGEILVNGVSVKDVTQHDLREQIGFVPQKGVLLSGTIASNLRYGRQEATDAEVIEAAQVAQAMEFISQKKEGFQSEIAEGGTNVSGGQKQRLSIARALAKKAPINIFDDSFSALDFKTDASLRRALKENTADSTTLIVAQRVSTIMTADQIIVLDEGKIVGMGTHKELLKNCPVYLEIASSQLSKEEL